MVIALRSLSICIMSENVIKDTQQLKFQLKDDIKCFFLEKGLNYDEDAIWKLARHSLDFIIRILNDADDLKNGSAIEKDDVKLATTLETENRMAICQPLPHRELLDISVVYNSKELPQIKSGYGLRIPLDNLTKLNYRLKNKPKELSSHIRKSILHNQGPSQMTYMNPFLSKRPMQIALPMCIPPKPVLGPMTSLQSSPYATLYAPQQPPVLTLPQHLYNPYIQQATLPATPQPRHQNTLSTLNQQPTTKVLQQSRIGLKKEVQMAPQRIIFRPRFNIVTGKENKANNNCNKRKAS